jgi:hypothetical protein
MAITIADLRNEVAAKRAATIVCITTRTVPKMRKTNNPYFGRVERVASRSGMFAANYQEAVNRQRVREGQPANDAGEIVPFVAEAMWKGKGEHVAPSIVRHTTSGEEYFAFYPTRTDEDGNPIANKDQWLLDGVPVEDEAILNDIKSFCQDQGDNEKQGTDKRISWRVFKMQSVREIRWNREIHEVVHA